MRGAGSEISASYALMQISLLDFLSESHRTTIMEVHQLDAKNVTRRFLAIRKTAKYVLVAVKVVKCFRPNATVAACIT